MTDPDCSFIDNQFSLVLNASDAVYDGKGHGGTLACEDLLHGVPEFNMIADSSLADSDITYWQGTTQLPGAPVNVGSYTAKLTAKIGGTDYTITKDYRITRRPVTVSGITAEDKVYDGTTGATLKFGTVTFGNILDGDSLSVSATGTFVSADANRAENEKTQVTISDLALGGDSKDSYVLADEGQQTTTEARIAQLEAKLAWKGTSFTYDGKRHAPTAMVTNLAAGDSCSVTVSGAQTEVGTYTATATKLSNANYRLPAKATQQFTIAQREAKLSWRSTSFVYDGKGHQPSATVTNLAAGDSCSVTVSGAQTEVGTYTATATKLSNANYKLPATATQQFTIARASIAKAKVTLAKTSYTCNGKARKPAVKSVVLNGRTLKKGTDYTVSYKSNIDPGTATVIVTGRGNYRDAAKATFQIKIAKAKLTTIGYVRTSTMDARWGKVVGAKSYQLQWRRVGGKWRTVSATGTSTTISGLEDAKLYQLRVRAVAGKQRGAWSNASLRYFRSLKGVKAAPGKSKGSVKATWQADESANGGYKVFVYAKRDGRSVATQKVEAGTTSATVRGLESGRTYYVRVRPYLEKSGTTYVGVISGWREVQAR